jgi:hypothetical protein
MSAQTGLSRRRAAAASSSNDPDDERPQTSDRPSLAQSRSTTNSFQDTNGTRASHAGTALAGGSKVAYDPRDLVGTGSGGDDEGRIPKLTLLEEVLLLGIKDRAVSLFLSFSFVQRCSFATWNFHCEPAVHHAVLILSENRIFIMSARRCHPGQGLSINQLLDTETSPTMLTYSP